MESDTPRTNEEAWTPVDFDEPVVFAAFARQLERELAAAIKQRDEARLDAERYRWLKSAGCYWVDILSQPHAALIFQGHASHDYLGNCEMDDAIDRAIATQKEGGGA